MRLPEPSKTLSFSTSQALSQWLKCNHATESELWVKIFKKSSSEKSVSWNDVVIECLCWGWIDGVKKSLDEHAYLQRITPRRPHSQWSRRNTEHVERLISEKRMKESGLIHVDVAKKDGRWENAYVSSQLEVPVDFIDTVAKNPDMQTFFNTLNKSHRYAIAYGLTSAKKPETRQRRFEKFITMLENEQKP